MYPSFVFLSFLSMLLSCLLFPCLFHSLSSVATYINMQHDFGVDTSVSFADIGARGSATGCLSDNALYVFAASPGARRPTPRRSSASFNSSTVTSAGTSRRLSDMSKPYSSKALATRSRSPSRNPRMPKVSSSPMTLDCRCNGGTACSAL